MKICDLPEDELEAFLDTVAERGAKKALARVGLHDEDAIRDVTELRGLLDSWRDVRKGAFTQLGKLMTLVILCGLLLLAGKHVNLDILK